MKSRRRYYALPTFRGWLNESGRKELCGIIIPPPRDKANAVVASLCFTTFGDGAIRLLVFREPINVGKASLRVAE